MSGPGKLIISLDFELYWGVRDRVSLSACADRLLGARAAIPRILEIFEQFQLHATWAIVGFLFAKDGKDNSSSHPQILPQYVDHNLSPYRDLTSTGSDETTDSYHFAPTLIELIRATPNQEIASHTYSHYYCLEEGQTLDAFRADTQAMVDVARQHGLHFKAIAFPRNQISGPHLDVCREHGIETFRGTPRHWPYNSVAFLDQSLLRRGTRLVDSYVPLLGYHTYSGSTVEHGIHNMPASSYFRPYYHRLRLLEWLKLKRIRDTMLHAAQRGEVCHIWWHPEDFGRNTDKNIGQLRALCQFFQQLHQLYGMSSRTMTEATQSFDE